MTDRQRRLVKPTLTLRRADSFCLCAWLDCDQDWPRCLVEVICHRQQCGWHNEWSSSSSSGQVPPHVPVYTDTQGLWTFPFHFWQWWPMLAVEMMCLVIGHGTLSSAGVWSCQRDSSFPAGHSPTFVHVLHLLIGIYFRRTFPLGCGHILLRRGVCKMLDNAEIIYKHLCKSRGCLTLEMMR